MTTTMSRTSATGASKGCGCSGGGAGGCTCGGGCGSCGCGAAATHQGRPVSAGACAPCEETAFTRPRFFAGQLLTEDDLEALNTYVVGKNRLHNARLFGDGVVCGFEVVCGPCGGAKLVVKAGYALDCCGNDLVLACDRELDANAMIASLREQLRPGHGCADPCAGQAQTPEPCDDPGGEPGEEPGGEESTSPTAAALYTSTRSPDEYCLYVRYTEQPAEPTAPYPVGDDCAAGPCEPTRVREGVTFELRCRPRHAEPEDALSRVVAMLDELSPGGRTMKELGFLTYAERTARSAIARYEAGRVELGDDERAAWQTWLGKLGSNTPGDEPRVELLSRFAVEIGGVSLRAAAQTAGAGPRNNLPDPELTRRYLDEAAAEIGRTKPEGESGIVAAGRQAVELYQSLAAGQRARTAAAIQQLTATQQLYLHGWAHGTGVHRRLARAIRDVQRATARAINLAGSPTDCLARDAVSAIPVFAADVDSIGIEDVRAVVRSASVMSRLTRRFVRDQACQALLPPCPPCDDTAVLLACIKVVGCQVVEICNLERRMVWSPTALRHWLPPATWLAAAVEEACCGGDLADVGDAVQRRVDQRVAALELLVDQPGVGSLARVAHRFYSAAPHPRALAETLSPLVALGRASAPPAAPAAPPPDMVTRAELDAVVARLKVELARQPIIPTGLKRRDPE